MSEVANRRLGTQDMICKEDMYLLVLGIWIGPSIFLHVRNLRQPRFVSFVFFFRIPQLSVCWAGGMHVEAES